MTQEEIKKELFKKATGFMKNMRTKIEEELRSNGFDTLAIYFVQKHIYITPYKSESSILTEAMNIANKTNKYGWYRELWAACSKELNIKNDKLSKDVFYEWLYK